MLCCMCDIIDCGFFYLVVEIDGQVVGYVYVNIYCICIVYQWIVENLVYVDVVFQGKGVGIGLLQVLIDVCIVCGYWQMVVVIGELINIVLIKLYECFGFEWVGVFCGFGCKYGCWFDIVQMQCVFGDGVDIVFFNE